MEYKGQGRERCEECRGWYRPQRSKLIYDVLGQEYVVSFRHTFKGHPGFVRPKRVLRSQQLVHVFKDGVKWYCRLFCQSPCKQLA